MSLFRTMGFQSGGGRRILDLFAETFPFFFHFCRRYVLFPEFVEIADRLIRYFLGFPEDSIGLLIGFPDDPVPLRVQLFLALCGLLF